MVTIFKEIEQLRDFITIDVSSDLSVIMPYLKQAEKYVRNIVGDELFDQLINFVNGEVPITYQFEEESITGYPMNAVTNYDSIVGLTNINDILFTAYYEDINGTNIIASQKNSSGNNNAIFHGSSHLLGEFNIYENNQSGVHGTLTLNQHANMGVWNWKVKIIPSQNPNIEELLPYCQLALANFGYWLAIDKLNVNVGNAGITVASTASLVPASKERIDRLRESVKQSGYDALEEIIKFLEKNIDNYPEWKDSDAYSYNKQFFINNADEFYKTIHKQITRLQFLAIKEFIALAEIEIKGVVCVDLFTELKTQILSGEISDPNKVLLENIQPAVCYLSLNKQNEDTLYKNEAARLIETLRLFLNANAEDYPLYLDSNCYSSTIKADLNSDESGVFTFGL